MLNLKLCDVIWTVHEHGPATVACPSPSRPFHDSCHNTVANWVLFPKCNTSLSHSWYSGTWCVTQTSRHQCCISSRAKVSYKGQRSRSWTWCPVLDAYSTCASAREPFVAHCIMTHSHHECSGEGSRGKKNKNTAAHILPACVFCKHISTKYLPCNPEQIRISRSHPLHSLHPPSLPYASQSERWISAPVGARYCSYLLAHALDAFSFPPLSPACSSHFHTKTHTMPLGNGVAVFSASLDGCGLDDINIFWHRAVGRQVSVLSGSTFLSVDMQLCYLSWSK